MIYEDGGVGMLYAVHVALKEKEGWHYCGTCHSLKEAREFGVLSCKQHGNVWGMIERVRTGEKELLPPSGIREGME